MSEPLQSEPSTRSDLFTSGSVANGSAMNGSGATGSATVGLYGERHADVDPEQAVKAAIVAAVRDTPGVLGLEPTLSTLIQRVGRTGADGLVMTRHGRILDVDLNVSTSSTHQARSTVIGLRARIVDLIAAHGLAPGSVEISVLSIDEPAAV